MIGNIVLNTRPTSMSMQTNEAFTKIGFEVIDYPCIEIVESDDIEQCRNQINQINPNSTIIFTSQQSVIYAFKILSHWKISQSSIIVAIGSKTSQCLEQYINNNIFVPDQQNSNGVIDLLSGLKKSNSIALISAENGRKKIQNYVIDSNIELTQINVYKRQVPAKKYSQDWLKNLSEINILATSNSILDNLKELLEDENWIKIQNQLVVCASSRIDTHAQALGFENTFNTESANPNIMAKKLSDFLSIP